MLEHHTESKNKVYNHYLRLLVLVTASTETQVVDMKSGQCVSVVNTTGDEFIGKSAQPT